MISFLAVELHMTLVPGKGESLLYPATTKYLVKI